MSKIPELLVASGKFKQDITRIYELVDALEAAEPEPELRALLAERDALRELVVHMWINDGYPRNGYSDMTTEQKVLYEKTIEDGVS